MTDSIEPATSSSPTTTPTLPISLIYQRFEPFEQGFLPIPKLILTDPTQSLALLKDKFAYKCPNHRLDSATLGDALQISIDHAKLELETLASVLHHESEPLD